MTEQVANKHTNFAADTSNEPPASMLDAVNLLTGIANRIAANEQHQAKVLSAMQQRLEQLVDQTVAVRDELPEDKRDAFARVEAALNDLTSQVDEAGRARLQSDEPWDEATAEELTAHYEAEGYSPEDARTRAVSELEQVAPQQGAPLAYAYTVPISDTPDRDWFEDRFAGLEASLAARDTRAEAAPPPADVFAAILDKFDDLDARLETVLADKGASDTARLEDLESCIGEIAEHIDMSNQRLARIDSVEKRIAELADQLANQPAPSAGQESALDAAMVANLIADRLNETAPVGPAAQSGDGATSAEFAALASTVKEFVAERRNETEHANAVIDTMQQSMIRLLDRMEALEEAAPQEVVSEPRQPQATVAVEPTIAYAPEPAAPPAPEFDELQYETTDEDPVIDRLQQVADELNDPGPPSAQHRSRTDYADAARRAAQSARQKKSPGAQKKKKASSPGPLDDDRARFAEAASRAAASANRRANHERKGGRVIDGTSDDFALNAATESVLSKPGSFQNRSRLVIAAAAVIALGLGATTLYMGLFSKAKPVQTQSRPVKQGSKFTSPGAAGASKLAEAAKADGGAGADRPVEQAARDDNIAPGSVSYAKQQGRLVQPTALPADGGVAGTDDQSSGSVAGSSRKALPSALIGPLSLRLAAANGDASAEFEVGARFAEGKGVKQDFVEALKWYKRSASRGFALAQYRLGTHYERGLGVAKDPERARIWYQRAAEKDNVKAMHNLAVLLAGPGKPDYTTAASWFAEAAERGLGDSQFNLAILYQTGLGISRNEELAYKWLSLAARTGDNEAQKRKSQVAKKLAKKRIAAIDKEVAAWLRKPSSRIANDPHVAGQAWKKRNSDNTES